MQWTVTNHAIERFKERIHPLPTKEAHRYIMEHIQSSEVCGKLRLARRGRYPFGAKTITEGNTKIVLTIVPIWINQTQVRYTKEELKPGRSARLKFKRKKARQYCVE